MCMEEENSCCGSILVLAGAQGDFSFALIVDLLIIRVGCRLYLCKRSEWVGCFVLPIHAADARNYIIFGNNVLNLEIEQGRNQYLD